MLPQVEGDLVQGAHLPGGATMAPQKAVEDTVEVNLVREMATVVPHPPEEEETDIPVDHQVSWEGD